MNKGILIFAINSQFDYVRSAEFAAKQAKKFTGLPVTLVTASPVESSCFDAIIQISDSTGTVRPYMDTDRNVQPVKWFNESRVLAYELSPYDQTLLIDADYFMFNDTLKTVFDTNTEFACFTEVNDLVGEVNCKNRLDEISIPMLWATVIYFRKCAFSESVFQFMKHIKSNWVYYSMVYHFKNHNFRNDYALSIALQALSGYTTKVNSLPGKLHSLFSNADVRTVSERGDIFFSDGSSINKISGINIHCMNKMVLEKFYATS